MKMQIKVILMILSFMYSCNTTKENKYLNDSPFVVDVFTSEEIVSLQDVVSFFDSSIIQESNAAVSIDNAYTDFFAKISKQEEIDEIYLRVGLKKSDQARVLLKKLEISGMFNEIWQYHEIIDYHTNDTIGEKLKLCRDSKYWELLKQIGVKDPFISTYVESIEAVGKISPSSISQIMHEYDEVDFLNELYRLIFAIHYITICSEIEFELK